MLLPKKGTAIAWAVFLNPYSQPQTSKPELGRALDGRGQGGPPEAPRVDARELAVDPLAPVPVAEVAHQLLEAKPRIVLFGTQAISGHDQATWQQQA